MEDKLKKIDGESKHIISMLIDEAFYLKKIEEKIETQDFKENTEIDLLKEFQRISMNFTKIRDMI